MYRNISIISFTQNGIHLSEMIGKNLGTAEYLLFTKCSAYFSELQEMDVPIQFVEESLSAWTKEQMEKGNALLFIGACGIAVRAIAPFITDKLHDSPVLVMDEKGKYVIPILAGHMGGANELAHFIAEKTGAEPVITTATDINQKFSVDMFAKKNNLFIVNKDGIAKVSAKVLAQKEVTIAIEPGHGGEKISLPQGIHFIAYPPKQPVDILITSENSTLEIETALLLRPKEYVIGMGCRKGKEAEKIEDLIEQSLHEMGISYTQIAVLASIDVKSKEEGLLAWSRTHQVPFLTYTAEELQGVKGVFHPSDFVRERVGVDNVCERAALRACGPDGKLVYEKHAVDGMTIAIAKREWSVTFYE